MTRRHPFQAMLAAGLIALGAAATAGADAPIPRPSETTLPNGLHVLVVRQPRLPLVTLQLVVPGGSAVDPPGREGTAAMTAQLLLARTTSRAPDDFAEALQRLGGDLSSQATRDYSVMTGSFLTRDLETGFELMSNAVLDPLFDGGDLERLRIHTYRPLAGLRDNPAVVADDQVLAMGFGGRPCGRPVRGTPRSIEAITRETVRQYYRDVWRPDRAVLAVVGDVTPERAVALASDWFGRWEGRSTVTTTSALVPPERPRLALVDQPGMGWAEIRLALTIPPERGAAETATTLAMSALATGPSSRLARLPGGVAGGAPHAAVTSLHDGRLLTVALAVPVDSAASAVRRLRAELRAFSSAPLTRDELAAVQRQLSAGFSLTFETLIGVASQWQSAVLDSDVAGVAETPARIAATTPAQVVEAARHWLDTERAVVVVVGPAARLRPALETLGPVETVEPADQSPLVAGADSLASAAPERVARGRALVEHAIAAHGGADRVRGIHDSIVGGQIALHVNDHDLNGRFTRVRREPYRMVSVVRLLSLQTKLVLDGRIGWVQASTDTLGEPLDSLGVEGLRATYDSDLPHLLLAAADPAARVIWRGSDPPGGPAAAAVDVVTARGERRRYHFEDATGLLIGVDLFGPGDVAAVLMTRITFGGWQTVDGLRWPMTESRLGPGDNMVRLDVDSVRLNQGVSDTNFARPIPGR